MKLEFGKGRKFKPEEVVLYMQCVKLIKETYPNAYDIDGLIRDCYNNNRNPNMRSLEEIEDDSRIK